MEIRQKIISFDFDETLCDSQGNPIKKYIKKLIKHHKNNDKIIITTFRRHSSKNHVEDFIEKYNLPVEEIVCTEHQPKLPFLMRKNAAIHYDDDIPTINSLLNSGIIGKLVN